MNERATIAVLGEPMIELSPAGPDLVRIGVAGDTYNAAVMMSRLGHPVRYLTGLGDDEFSARILSAMQHHGLDTSGILTIANRSPGLYAISNSATGERTFAYWRDGSAARAALTAPPAIDEMWRATRRAGHFYWSGITLALMSPPCRDRWLTALIDYRTDGGVVYFDTNYRARLWADESDVREWYERAIMGADYLLPSVEDLTAVFGWTSGSQAIAELAKAAPRARVALTGAGSAFLYDGNIREIPLAVSDRPVDTTGAGDAFSGAFVAAIVRGSSVPDAAQQGHLAASRVVAYPGAILPDEAWIELTESFES